jgi:hypothetical protein
MSATRPTLDYLITCSQMSLESVELSRLNLASNLRKEFQQILEEWIESEVDARLARSVLDWRRAQSAATRGRNYEPPKSVRFQQLVIAFLPDPAESRTSTSPANAARLPDFAIRVDRRLPAEVSRPNPLVQRWTSLANAAALGQIAIDGLEGCQSKASRGNRKIVPHVKTDRQSGHGSARASVVPTVRILAPVAIELVPVRELCDSETKPLSAILPVRSQARIASTSVAPAARTPARCADLCRRWLPSVSRSGDGGALRMATGDAS